MKKFWKPLTAVPAALAALLAVLLLAGCETLEPSNPVHPPAPVEVQRDILNIGDPITVIFSDTPNVTAPFEERIKSDGSITLLYSQTFMAAGKTRGDLEKEIRARYVPDYYKNLTVTVKPAERYYFVDGEVKYPNRFLYNGDTTVLKAIASAQGFTDFAKKSAVRVTRSNGQTFTVDCDAARENSALDLPVYPGDKVIVPRRYL